MRQTPTCWSFPGCIYTVDPAAQSVQCSALVRGRTWQTGSTSTFTLKRHDWTHSLIKLLQNKSKSKTDNSLETNINSIKLWDLMKTLLKKKKKYIQKLAVRSLFNRLKIIFNSYSMSQCWKHLHECKTLIFSSASESRPAKVTLALSSSSLGETYSVSYFSTTGPRV